MKSRILWLVISACCCSTPVSSREAVTSTREAVRRVVKSEVEVVSAEDLLEKDLTHHVVLDKQGHFLLQWLPEKETITFRLTVKTLGYVGVGFSPTAGMNGADIALGWVADDSGKVVLTDRHGVGNYPPLLDRSQDLVLEGGKQNDTHTVIQFYRPWKSCDKDDIDLGPDTVRVIWAYGEEDPVNAHQLRYHSLLRRGVRSVHLAEPAQDKSQLEGYKVWDLKADNLLLPEDDHTHYWCRIYRAPELERKHHMVALEPLIQPGNEPYVHHIVLYECHIPAAHNLDAAGATTADWFQRHVDQPGEPCYSPNMPQEWSFCLATNAWAWAVGSEGERLPDHTGMPLGEEWGGATYFMLETHYDNPAMHYPLRDSSGIRIHYTDQLRQYDTGMLLVGSEVNFLQFVPPKQNLFTSLGHCSSQCTQAGLPDSGIKIISGVLHSHLAGRKMRLRHIRRGVELPVILEDNQYDFNFQASRIPSQETTVFRGDELLLECDYNTSTRDQPTFGGLSTREEMCLAFILYYPRSALADCRSLPALHTLTSALGIQQVYGESFKRLVEFMQDIGGDVSAGSAAESTLVNLLNSLSAETGHKVPSLPSSRPASSGPLTEADILAKPFYTVAAPEPEPPEQSDTNYRTLLMELLLQLRVNTPASLHNLTVGEVLANTDWEAVGPDVEAALVHGEHNTLCLAHGRHPLIPYEPVQYPQFKSLPVADKSGTCKNHKEFGRGHAYLPLLKSSCLSITDNVSFMLTTLALVIKTHLFRL